MNISPTLATILCSVFITACATAPTPLIVAPKEVVKADVVVTASCVTSIPASPELVEIPKDGISAQTLARIKREQQLKEYGDKLYAILLACKDPK